MLRPRPAAHSPTRRQPAGQRLPIDARPFVPTAQRGRAQTYLTFFLFPCRWRSLSEQRGGGAGQQRRQQHGDIAEQPRPAQQERRRHTAATAVGRRTHTHWARQTAREQRALSLALSAPRRPRYAGRKAAASTATGFKYTHISELHNVRPHTAAAAPPAPRAAAAPASCCCCCHCHCCCCFPSCCSPYCCFCRAERTVARAG